MKKKWSNEIKFLILFSFVSLFICILKMDKTPVKQSTINRLCLVCASTANRPSRIESTKSKYNLRDLLLKYGGINAESGLICRNCVNKLFGLHEKCVDFYNQCQSNYKRTVLKSKRLLPTTPSGASPRNLKRQNVSETPKNRAQTPSKIPTPIKTHTTPRTDQRSSKIRLNFGSGYSSGTGQIASEANRPVPDE